MKILVVNGGSSSDKLSLYDIQNEELVKPLWKGQLDRSTCQKEERQKNLSALIKTLWSGETQVIDGPQEIERIVHRVVHGGKTLQHPTLITQEVKKQIRELIPLAPLHNSVNLEGIELLEQLFPTLPQIAIFDTAFHSHLPEVTQTYPLPYEWKEEGIQRYGFHGISHHYCAERAYTLIKTVPSPFHMINCHLGNGSSLCAIKEGKSVDTTMGFTPLEGLMMGSRSGSIDPGIIFYLLREKRYTWEEIEEILNFESGLKGIGGFSDMREIVSHPNAKAALAFQMFVYRLRGYIGYLMANLGKLDVLSFTGGIGENSETVREAVCERLDFLGIKLDRDKNRDCVPDQDISGPESRVRLLVIHTEEEWMMAKECRQV